MPERAFFMPMEQIKELIRIERNKKILFKKMQEAFDRGAKIIVFPELCITGYTCQDLFLQETLLSGALDALRKIIDHTDGHDSLVFVGLPVERQQKLYNVDGFLYYSVNDWYEMGENQGLNSKHEVSDFPYDVYGNGVLVYCGAPFGEYGPVGCLRLECVRDGIEDYEYLTMLAEQYDKETVDLIIRRLTTSLSEYNTDEEFFTALRIAVGNLLEQAVND